MTAAETPTSETPTSETSAIDTPASPTPTADAAPSPTAPPPPVLRSVTVPRTPADAFAAFTARIGAWWPLPTHGMFGERAGGLAFEGGELVERATDGEAAVWAEVLAWEPPHRLVLRWHPGRTADDASEVEIRFLAAGTGTRVELEHRGWERFGAEAPARRRGYVGPGAWGAVLEHFADVAEPRPDAPDLGALEAAYELLWAEALAGGFGAPPPGEWGAEQVIAHVTLNDLAMVAVAHALVHRWQPTFENDVCQEPAVLAAHIDRFGGDLPALVAHGREIAAVACAAVARLDAQERETLVHCRLRHDGEIVLDQELPWGQVAVTVQAARHLPAHVGQLRDLRSPTESDATG